MNGGTTLGTTNTEDRFPKRVLSTKAEQAEIKIKRDVFEGEYGKQFGTMLFAKFVGDPRAADDEFGEGTFLDWARHNKRSWKHDQFRVHPLLRTFADKTLGESRQVQSKLLRA